MKNSIRPILASGLLIVLGFLAIKFFPREVLNLAIILGFVIAFIILAIVGFFAYLGISEFLGTRRIRVSLKDRKFRTSLPIISSFSFGIESEDDGSTWKVIGSFDKEKTAAILAVFSAIDEKRSDRVEVALQRAGIPISRKNAVLFSNTTTTDPKTGKIIREVRIEMERGRNPLVVKE